MVYCDDIAKDICLAEIWHNIRAEAEQAAASDAAVSIFFHHNILAYESLSELIVGKISDELALPSFNKDILEQALLSIALKIPLLEHYIAADILAAYKRDPACCRLIEPVLYYKGFIALQVHRFAYALWHEGRKDFSLFLQSRSSIVFQTDIHPAAQIGCAIFLDHATGLVVGETAVIEDNVSILHGVTLGGTGKEKGDRHPKIRQGVLIGAGAKILGNIEVGSCARVASGSVVLKDVPPYATVAGIPAKIVGQGKDIKPAQTMDQNFDNGSGI